MGFMYGGVTSPLAERLDARGGRHHAWGPSVSPGGGRGVLLPVCTERRATQARSAVAARSGAGYDKFFNAVCALVAAFTHP